MSYNKRSILSIVHIIFVSNILVHYSECQGNFDKETVLKPSHFDAQLSGVEYFRPNSPSESRSDSAVPWEDALKYTTYLTLSEISSGSSSGIRKNSNTPNSSSNNEDDTTEHNDNDDHQGDYSNEDGGDNNAKQSFAPLFSKANIQAAKMVDFKQRRVPQFGDIVLLAMGTLEQENGELKFVESRVDMCPNQIDQHCIQNLPMNVLAIWSVQKIRRRDAGNYKFELRFGVFPIAENLMKENLQKTALEPKLRHFILKQEDYPNYFDSDGFLKDQNLRKRTDFFEGVDEYGSMQSRSEMYDMDRPYEDSIDRTLFDLMPFFDDRASVPRSPSYTRQIGGYNQGYRYSAARPQVSSSDIYNYYAQAQNRVPTYKRPTNYGGYNSYSQSMPGAFNTFQASPSAQYKQSYYKVPNYVRFPDTKDYSQVLKTQPLQPANYQYYAMHPSQTQIQPSVIQPQHHLLPQQPIFANPQPVLQAQPSVQQFTSSDPSGMANYFQTRNKVSVPKSVYYQRPYADYKSSESVQQPKKTMYYTNIPSFDVNFGGLKGFKDPLNAFTFQNQKFAPIQHQQTSPYLSQPVNVPAAQSYHHALPLTPNYQHSVIPQPQSQQSVGNPYFFQHMQMVTPSGVQQQPQFHPQIIAQVSVPPLSTTRMTTTFRFPPSIPFQYLTSAQPQFEFQPSNTFQPSSIQPQKQQVFHKDIFQGVRNELQGKQQQRQSTSKFSEPDPLYHKEIFTTPTSFTKVTATPKISYFFPKDDDDSDFKPMIPPSSMSSIGRRNFSEPEIKPNYFENKRKPNPASKVVVPRPVKATVKLNNIIYGQIDSKVLPPTVQPDKHSEDVKAQLPAPTKGYQKKKKMEKTSTTVQEAVVTTARSFTMRPQTTLIRRASVAPSYANTPVNLITSTSTTTTTTSAPLTTTTTAATTSNPNATTRAYLPRGSRQWNRNKSDASSTEKPVLKWMPKRKRPKAENSTKIAATLNNAVFFHPTISNRTRAVYSTVKPLDDVNFSSEDSHHQSSRRQEKLIQLPPGTDLSDSSDMVVEQTKQNTVTVSRNKKRKNLHNYTNFVTVPTTIRPLPAIDEVIPEPQKNIQLTTTVSPMPITTTTEYFVMEKDVPITTLTPVTSSTPLEPEIVDMVKANLKTIPAEPDSSFKIFKASSSDFIAEDKAKEEDPNADDDDEEEEEDGLDLLAKTIVAHAKQVFSDSTDSNNLTDAAGSIMEKRDDD